MKVLFLIFEIFSCFCWKFNDACAQIAGGTTSCSNCPTLTIQTGGDSTLVVTPTLTVVKDVNGCTTTTVSCTGRTATSILILQWFNNGQDVGSSGTAQTDIGTITRTVTCNTAGNFILTDNGLSQTVSSVQCLST